MYSGLGTMVKKWSIERAREASTCFISEVAQQVALGTCELTVLWFFFAIICLDGL